VADGCKVCEQCGSKFICEISAGKSTCWCFDLPRVMPVIPSTDCLCPSCLDKAVKLKQASLTIQPTDIQE
jgi:uncharacterized protein